MNTFCPKEGGRQKREVPYRVFCLPGSLHDLHATLCIRCREQLPALVAAAAPVTLSCSPGGTGHGLLDLMLLWGPPGCGTESAGQWHRRGFAGWCVCDAAAPQG